MEPRDLSSEIYREYEWVTSSGLRVYRIYDPKTLWVGNTTHRVLDATGVVHLVPSIIAGCAIRWRPRDSKNPVQF